MHGHSGGGHTPRGNPATFETGLDAMRGPRGLANALLLGDVGDEERDSWQRLVHLLVTLALITCPELLPCDKGPGWSPAHALGLPQVPMSSQRLWGLWVAAAGPAPIE